MSAFTTMLIGKALDGLSARSEITAQNIANAQSPGYAPVRVRFEEALASAAAKKDPRLINAVRAQMIADPNFLPGDHVRLDEEIATGATTAGRYAALVELLNRELQIHAIAISGGR